MKKLIKQIARFGIVGVLATLIDYGIFAGLTILGLHYLVAQVISFMIAHAFNYWASIKWVFDAKKQTAKEVILFWVLGIGGLLLNSILLYIGVDIYNYHELIVNLFATGVVMVYNFITRKLIIEKRV